jgi:hypothetical protein
MSLDLNLPTTASDISRHEVTTAGKCANDDNDFDDDGDNTNNNDNMDGDGVEGGKGEGKEEGEGGCRVKGRRGRAIHTGIMNYRHKQRMLG